MSDEMPSPRHKPIPGPESLTEEWFSKRFDIIGSSEAARACGLSEYGTPLHVYLEKIGVRQPFSGNRRTKRGRRFEPIIAEDWQEITGRTLVQYPCPMYLHPEHSFMAATPDGMIDAAEGLEIKSTTRFMAEKLGEEGSDFIPPDWYVQAQQQIAVMDWDRVHFCVQIDIDEDPLLYLIHRNDPMIALMIKAERELIERIHDRRPPEPDWKHPSTLELIREMHSEINDTRIILNEREVAAWAAYERWGREIKLREKARNTAKAFVLCGIGDNEAGILPDGRMVKRAWRAPVTYTTDKKGYIHVSAMKCDGGRIVERSLTAEPPTLAFQLPFIEEVMSHDSSSEHASNDHSAGGATTSQDGRGDDQDMASIG